MILKWWQLTLTSSLITSLFLVCETISYAAQTPSDNKGWQNHQAPAHQAPQSSFNKPSFKNSSPSPIREKPNAMQMQPHNMNNHQNMNNRQTPNTNYQHHGHDNNHKDIRTYYYNNNVFPYYDYPVGDDSYSYTNSSDTTSSDDSSADTTDNQTYLPSYDPAALPNGNWVAANNGDIPDQAIVFQMIDNSPIYYCRIQNNDSTYYGVLVPNGCTIQDQSATTSFSQYEVLVSPQ